MLLEKIRRERGAFATVSALVAGVIPTGRTFADLANALVHGWKRLVTGLTLLSIRDLEDLRAVLVGGLVA